MAAPTEAEIRDQWQDIVDFLEENREHGEVNAKNVVDMIDTVIAGLETDFADQLTAVLAIARARYSEFLSISVALQIWILRTYAKAINETSTEPQAIIDALFEHFAEYESAAIGPDASGTGFAFAATTITR